MWERHWRLSGDPFLGPRTPFVKTAGHEEAFARLVAAIESGQRLAVLRAGEGMGKSAVLARAWQETRGPQRRFARVVGPLDGADLFARLAAGLGANVSGRPTRPGAWKALSEALKLCRWQDLHAVLVIDDAHELVADADRRDLARLARLEPAPGCRLTVVQSVCEAPDGGSEAADSPYQPAWQLRIGIPPLTRSETERYVAEKLAAAGRTEPAFTPRALARLHELSGGVPRGIDHLGSLALMAGAVRGLEVIPLDVISGVALECGTAA
jgi:type II secretory pathway predicted ATPase ExeA